MNKEHITKALQALRQQAKKRKFSQSVDVIFNLQDLDFKKPEHQVDFFSTLRHQTGKRKKICALVGPELEEEAKKTCDLTVLADQFSDFQNNKVKLKKLAKQYDFFIGQATIMPKIAQVFGRYLGPRNKMPNPKVGAVVPPKANLKPLVQKLQNTLRVVTRKDPLIQLLIGNEGMSDADIMENLITIHDQLLHNLPREQHNLRSVFLKFTMSRAIKIYPNLVLEQPSPSPSTPSPSAKQSAKPADSTTAKQAKAEPKAHAELESKIEPAAKEKPAEQPNPTNPEEVKADA